MYNKTFFSGKMSSRMLFIEFTYLYCDRSYVNYISQHLSQGTKCVYNLRLLNERTPKRLYSFSYSNASVVICYTRYFPIRSLHTTPVVVFPSLGFRELGRGRIALVL